MGQYYEEAKKFAEFYNSCHAVSTLPEVPVSNMFHVHFSVPLEKLEPLLIGVYQATGVGLTGYLKPLGNGGCSFETNIGDLYEDVPEERKIEAFKLLDQKLSEIIG